MLPVNAWTYPAAWLVRQATRHWQLPQNPREKLALAFFKRDGQRSYPFLVWFDDVRYRGNFSEYVDWRVFFLGNFERESLNLCRYLAPRASGDVFVDIGGFHGLYDIFLAKHFAKAVVFEPFPDNQTKLLQALADNNITNVELRRFALGDAESELEFYDSPDGTTGQGSLVKPDGDAAKLVMKVPVRRGDDELAGLVSRIGLIKIDVEGYERFVLTGLKKTLEQARPFVLFELGDSSKPFFSSSDDLVQAFPSDYSFYEVSDHSTAPQFVLKELSKSELLTRTITNNLACPSEQRHLIAPFIRQDWIWAKTNS
jgi:FkbM family methyltransferase